MAAEHDPAWDALSERQQLQFVSAAHKGIEELSSLVIRTAMEHTP
jgi:hypothetical protein